MQQKSNGVIPLSHRGGKRAGSGRKPGEGSKLVRVPLGCLDKVTEIINAYRVGLVPASEGLSESCNENQIPLTLGHDRIASNRRSLDKLPGADRRKIIKSYGSLQAAAESGVYAVEHSFGIIDIHYPD